MAPLITLVHPVLGARVEGVDLAAPPYGTHPAWDGIIPEGVGV